jgi:hypothetical protein
VSQPSKTWMAGTSLDKPGHDSGEMAQPDRDARWRLKMMMRWLAPCRLFSDVVLRPSPISAINSGRRGVAFTRC